LEELTIELGGLDLFVISSGIGEINEALDFEIEKQTIDTNIVGFTSIADWTFNYFEKQQSGHLVVISSIGGIRGSCQAPAYNASKAYQINYAEGLRQKAAKLKMPIFITDIRPGLVDTKMAKGEGLFWVMPLEKAVNQMYNAIVRKKKVVYVTKRWRLIAMILKLIPRPIYDRM
jgi:short-subunit dehydrogenase